MKTVFWLLFIGTIVYCCDCNSLVQKIKAKYEAHKVNKKVAECENLFNSESYLTMKGALKDAFDSNSDPAEIVKMLAKYGGPTKMQSGTKYKNDHEAVQFMRDNQHAVEN